MPELRVVTNASPLIYLAVLNRFSLLNDLFQDVYVPTAVYQEVAVHGAGQPGANETAEAVERGWLQRADVQSRISVDALLDELDLGEAEAIVVAREQDISHILLDDRMARNKADLMGLTVTGTIGVLLLARQRGIDIDLKHDLDVLIEHNFRIAPHLYESLVASTQ